VENVLAEDKSPPDPTVAGPTRIYALNFATFPSSRFCGVVGYHFCLTHRRSPVRTRAESLLLLFASMFFVLGERCALRFWVAKLFGKSWESGRKT
jgi:hypothetical protein